MDVVEEDGSDAETTPTDGGDVSGQEATFSQADLNRVAVMERKGALTKFASDLGLDSVDDLKQIITDKAEAEAAKKSELEQIGEKLQASEDKYKALETRLYKTTLRNAFNQAAAGQVSDTDMAFLVADNLGLLNGQSGIEVDIEAGKVSGLEDVVKKLIEVKPILKKITPASPGGTSGSDGGNNKPSGLDVSALKARYGI